MEHGMIITATLHYRLPYARNASRSSSEELEDVTWKILVETVIKTFLSPAKNIVLK